MTSATASAYDQLTALFGEPEEFNTNNAWGFGGGAGYLWSKGGVQVKLFTASYRHTPPSRVVTVAVDGKRIFDEVAIPRSVNYAVALASTKLGVAP